MRSEPVPKGGRSVKSPPIFDETFEEWRTCRPLLMTPLCVLRLSMSLRTSGVHCVVPVSNVRALACERKARVGNLS